MREMQIKAKVATLVNTPQTAKKKKILLWILTMADVEFAYTAHGSVNWYNYEKLLDSTALTMHMSGVSDSISRHTPYRNAYKYSSQTQEHS